MYVSFPFSFIVRLLLQLSRPESRSVSGSSAVLIVWLCCSPAYTISTYDGVNLLLEIRNTSTTTKTWTLTWHTCKCKVHKLHQRYILEKVLHYIRIRPVSVGHSFFHDIACSADCRFLKDTVEDNLKVVQSQSEVGREQQRCFLMLNGTANGKCDWWVDRTWTDKWTEIGLISGQNLDW